MRVDEQYPIMEYDKAREAVIEPGKGEILARLPKKLALCFFQDALEEMESRGELEIICVQPSEHGARKFYRTLGAAEPVAVVHPGLSLIHISISLPASRPRARLWRRGACPAALLTARVWLTSPNCPRIRSR